MSKLWKIQNNPIKLKNITKFIIKLTKLEKTIYLIKVKYFNNLMLNQFNKNNKTNIKTNFKIYHKNNNL